MAISTGPLPQSRDLQFSTAAQLPTSHGVFQVQAVREHNGHEHLVVVKGDLTGRDSVPLRIHSECTTAGGLHSLRCDCDQQLAAALDYFEAQGFGILIYLRQEGRGIGLFNKIEAYALQDTGLDTVEANAKLGFPIDLRTYEIAFRVLEYHGIESVRLLTNNPKKMLALQNNGIVVTNRVPIQISSNEFNQRYLQAKKEKMAHFL
ncbi:MAG: GTP cyclohydrolase II [Gammaproteobacteria bacterium]|nr:GTP cyclohydrolase II [Gammaproteobacteria bacterium]